MANKEELIQFRNQIIA